MLYRDPASRPSAATLLDLALFQVEGHSDDEANAALDACCLTPTNQRLACTQAAATPVGPSPYQGFLIHGMGMP